MALFNHWITYSRYLKYLWIKRKYWSASRHEFQSWTAPIPVWKKVTQQYMNWQCFWLKWSNKSAKKTTELILERKLKKKLLKMFSRQGELSLMAKTYDLHILLYFAPRYKQLLAWKYCLGVDWCYWWMGPTSLCVGVQRTNYRYPSNSSAESDPDVLRCIKWYQLFSYWSTDVPRKESKSVSQNFYQSYFLITSKYILLLGHVS